MSPIPSVATAVTLSPATPPVALDPGSAGQSASVMSPYLLGTGGLLFAVVAIVSVAGYFYHGRGSASSAWTSNTWASLTSFLSSMRHRSATTTSTAAATDWPVDLEVDPEVGWALVHAPTFNRGDKHQQHVGMVYARFFHPTFWNVVECHPATPFTPAIYVEDEADEVPVSDPKPFGVNSFLDMDDDDGDRNGNDRTTHPCEKLDRGTRPRVEQLPPYDTSSETNVNFVSEIIGTTVRPGAFLAVPEELGDDPSESSDSDSELDFDYSPYDGIVTTPATPPSSSRRHGMADMAYLTQTLKDTILEEGQGLVPTVSFRTGLVDVWKYVEKDPFLSCTPLERVEPADDEPTISDCDTGVHDSHDDVQVSSSDAVTVGASHEGLDRMRRLLVECMHDYLTTSNCDVGAHDIRDSLQSNSGDADTLGVPHEGPDIMQRLLAELRDPDLDCRPRPLSEDSESEYSDGDEESGENVPRPRPPWDLRNARESNPRTDSDVSEEGPIYPLTPPPKFAASLADTPGVRKGRMASPVTLGFNDKVQVISPTASHSPPPLLSTVYVRTHRDSRSFTYGLRSPLVALPRF